MKKILFISPHFPPSNLAAVHRSRLFAQHLPAFGWEPVILTVHEDFYEEALDHNLEKMLPAGLRIEKVKAFNVTKPRIVGDIGLRAFFQLYKKAKELIRTEKFDFLYIPIPSFYIALLGRMLHRSTGIRYGIDYIDPWVHFFPGSNKLFSRHWFSTQIAKLLEPVAIKKASLITGVAEGYYQGVIERNPHLVKACVFGAMPYGGEEQDHQKLHSLSLKPYLFSRSVDDTKIKFVYAGAMLPKAYQPLESIFKAIEEAPSLFSNIEFHFVGTGRLANDANSHTIKPIAEKYGIWEKVVFEYPKRIPYLDVLIHLSIADGIFILGSTEPHYTPSKSYQGVLSGKPVLAVLHKESTASEVISKSRAGVVLAFDGENELNLITQKFSSFVQQFLDFSKHFDPANIDKQEFVKYSALNVTQQLAKLLDKVA